MQNAMFQADVDVDASATALAELSGGSVGEAMRLSLLGGLQIYAEIIGILGTLPQMDRARTLRLAEAAAQRGADEKLDLLFTLLRDRTGPPCPHWGHGQSTRRRGGPERGRHPIPALPAPHIRAARGRMSGHDGPLPAPDMGGL